MKNTLTKRWYKLIKDLERNKYRAIMRKTGKTVTCSIGVGNRGCCVGKQIASNKIKAPRLLGIVRGVFICYN